MSDNFTANPGAGGDTFAADDVGGVKYPISKIAFGALDSVTLASAANPLPVAVGTVPVTGTFWQATQPISGNLTASGTNFQPGYDIAGGAGAAGPLLRDPGGNLVTRGQVLTDEGGYRVNFANTSLAVSIGTATFVNGSDTVTGTGFLASDIRTGDYVKLNADAESAWSQVESLNSDTSLTLYATYAGAGGTGASSRSIIKPVTGTGATISVASGVATISAGTTASVFSELERDVDWLPVVKQSGVTISQRIANQTTYIGFYDESTPAAPKWFAWFVADGTVNTTLRCETGRNPTTAPTGNEIESTTVTLPNGATSASANRYRVEVLGDRVVFYVNSVLVATHFKAMPGPGDLLTSTVRVLNGITPATNTNVLVDYDTVINHNKLQVGLMSDSEQVVAVAAPLQQSSYTFTGVVAINTDLIVLDCLQLRSLFIQCTAMGTAGVVTVQWANDAAFTAPITATLLSESGATSTTFNAAVLRATNVMARYCRLRLTTATTALTTTINVWGAQTAYQPAVTTQPVSGTVTATVTGGTTVGVTSTVTNAILSSAATTNGTIAKATAGTIYAIVCSNTGAAVAYAKLHNSATITVGTTAVALTIPIPAGGVIQLDFGAQGMRYGTGICYSITNLAADTDATAVALNQVKVNLSYI